MIFPIFEPGPKTPESPEGLILQERCLDQAAPLFVRAWQSGLLGADPAPCAYALALANRNDLMEQVLVLTTLTGEALFFLPAKSGLRYCTAAWPLTILPEHWESFMAARAWLCVWQQRIGGPPCQEEETT